MLDIILWIAAVLLMGVGILGTVIPMIPGLPMIFAGAWLAAFIDHYDKINVWVVVLLGVLMLFGLAVDWIAQTMGAKKAGATKLGIVGSLIGTFVGIFTGLWGLIFMPLLGAAIGEFIDHQDMLRSGKVGFATWLGMIIGTVVKLALAFTMIGVVIADILI
ncbi:DUF456 domain-containing protein [Parasutterella muris]|uniref:DUF456 family protein n=1 Tax=Parasutterella muris TaxID=2565572 RepID=A0A6L6YIU5_9BURK|nr:DUF456 family protein [Parasutterella muris]MVX57284.1 DUF456 family protein [Parasutterella muris]